MRRPPPDASALVLDIGGDVGAVVVDVPSMPVSGELHAQPVDVADPAAHRFHTGVHLRWAGEAAANVAVFPAVRAGAYELLGADGTPVRRIVVCGGQVTRVRLP